MFRKVLIANRGAIACRIIRTLNRMGIASVAVYSDADRYSRHVRLASEAVRIGPAPALQSYLNADAVLAAAKQTGAEAIHPGYGFLSENTHFAEACTAAGITFIGPYPEHVRAFSLKHTARKLAEAAGVPLAPGSGLVTGVDDAIREAARIGYPVMLKSTAGGGGIGLQLVQSEADLASTLERVQRLAANNFKDAGVFIEKYVARGRHIEVQIFGDGKGRVLALGERDCSAQRRNQKVIEETPAPGLSEDVRQALFATAIRLGETVNYANAGTVEYLLDTDTGAFYFLEVNTRLQVEHGVTEEVTGIDLVEWMIRQAAGEQVPEQSPAAQGASIQVRLYAEDPARDFRPSSGLLTKVAWPDDARIETWVESGSEVSSYYDPMIAKLIVTGRDRPDALSKLKTALAATELAGIETNLGYLAALAHSQEFACGDIITSTLATFPYAPRTIEIMTPGTMTSIQDYPGRIGYWDVGVPPSGPMDHVSFRLANRAVGNPVGTPAIEMTLTGAVVKFHAHTYACLVGADMTAKLDGKPVANGVPFAVAPGQTLACGAISGAGLRTYLAIQGGLDIPMYLGSASTFSLGAFGGHGGRNLRAGDLLHLPTMSADNRQQSMQTVPDDILPKLSHVWEIGVLYGPHGAPEFFTEDDIATFFAAEWEVHYNSSRTGVRLIGPKPTWARTDGGEAGLHPSNLHDNAYAIGAVNFTGDMPVILGPDGPSLGGFVCPVTIVQGELWKVGQLRPGDKIRFKRLTPADARRISDKVERDISTLKYSDAASHADVSGLGVDAAIVGGIADHPGKPKVVYRRAGDRYMLVEYGPMVLDLELRFRVHGLMIALREKALQGIIELTPGVRTLQIHYDAHILPLETLLDVLAELDAKLDEADDITVASRIVRLPLSWDDATTQAAVDKYMQSVRADAPWCPSNIEFIRRINGLDSVDDVRRMVFEASYLVLGLGDVYLGAPLATPVDPRQRLVTTKYNPARTWTADGTVGIGGAYMCIYGMESPGGYQLIGRTVQVWNTYRQTSAFRDDKPWLLRFFDQVQFYPVTTDELAVIREDVLDGTAALDIVDTTFSLKNYRAFLAANASDISAAKYRQQAAFDAERARWKEADKVASAVEVDAPLSADVAELPPGAIEVLSTVPGSVWKVSASVGSRVAEGDILVIVESMKMEMTITAPCAGIIHEVRCVEGRTVSLGQSLVVLTSDQALAAE